MRRSFWLYILKLEQDKYYAGITSNTPEKRLKQHVNGFMAARWTRKYKPLKILDTKDLGLLTRKDAETFERKVVRKYIKLKGLNNVRGGELTDDSDYVNRFGFLFDKEGWGVITVIILMMLAIGTLTTQLYFK